MEVPQTFDWVTARSKCSSHAMFALLIETVDSDAKAMRALGRIKVEVNHVADGKVVVSRVTDDGHATGTVIFERTTNGISVLSGHPDRTTLFSGFPSLDADGRCRYQIDGAAYELWQVSRRALEALFFRG